MSPTTPRYAPCVGVMVVMSSSSSWRSMVVLPALSRPRTRMRAWEYTLGKGQGRVRAKVCLLGNNTLSQRRAGRVGVAGRGRGGGRDGRTEADEDCGQNARGSVCVRNQTRGV